jgi:AcrR family transcriptional regulator
MAHRQRKAEVSQKRVLDAAAKVFSENGYAGTTMRAIADKADLKAASIYYHYKSKNDMLTAMLDQGMNSVIESVSQRLEGLPEGTSGLERIQTAIHAHLSSTIENGDYTLATRRVFGQVPEDIRLKHMRLRNSYGKMWQEILSNAMEQGELRPDINLTLARLFVLGALNWAVEWFNPGGQTIDEVSDEFTSIVVNGIFDSTFAPAHTRAAE